MIPEIEKLEGFEKIHYQIMFIEDYPEKPIYYEYTKLEYVKLVADHFVPCHPICRRMEDYKECGEKCLPSRAIDIFAMRYINGHIDIDDSWRNVYLTSAHIQATLMGYKFDAEKFWFLILFIKDFIDGFFEVPVYKNSAYRDIIEIINQLENIDTRPGHVCDEFDKQHEITIRVDGGKVKRYDNPLTLKAIAYCLYASLQQMEERPGDFSDGMHHLGFGDDTNAYPNEAHLYKLETTEKVKEKITTKQYLFNEFMTWAIETMENPENITKEFNKKDLPEMARTSQSSVIYPIFNKKFFIQHILYAIDYTEKSKDESFLSNQEKLKNNLKKVEFRLNHNSHYPHGVRFMPENQRN